MEEAKDFQAYFDSLYFEIGCQSIEMKVEKKRNYHYDGTYTGMIFKKLNIKYYPSKTKEKHFTSFLRYYPTFKIFENDLRNINIEKWDDYYPPKTDTGFNWKIILDKTIKEGINNYPPQFNILNNLLKAYCAYFNNPFEDDDSDKIYFLRV